MVKSYHQGRASLFRKSIALNNIAISLLARQRFKEAASTFEDSLRVMRLAVDESFLSRCKEEECNDCVNNSSISSPEGQVELEEDMAENSQTRLENECRENKPLSVCKQEIVVDNAESFSSHLLQAAQKRLCNFTCSSPTTRVNSFSSVPYKRRQADEAPNILYSNRDCHSDGAKPRRDHSMGRKTGKIRTHDNTIHIDCSYSYAEGCGLLQEDIHQIPPQNEVSTVPVSQELLGLASAFDVSLAGIASRDESVKNDTTTCIYPVWIESLGHNASSSADYDYHSPVRTGDDELVGHKEEHDGLFDDEINMVSAIITYNLSITFQGLAHQEETKGKSSNPHKRRLNEAQHIRYTDASFRMADLVLELLNRLSVLQPESSCEFSHLYTISTLRTFIFQFKGKEFFRAAQYHEANSCTQLVEYYREILNQMEIVVNQNRNIAAAA